MRFFSTAGPVRPGEHYLIPPLSRIDPEDVLGLVRERKYFVLHAPRTGAGHLVVIDCRENRSWEEKVFHRRRGEGPSTVDVWGM